MILSSSHNPQHDGQTEIVNKFFETMIQAYIAADKSKWAEWIELLEFAYNSVVHSSTGAPPFKLLLGYQPRSLIEALTARELSAANASADRTTAEFLDEITMHHDSAHLAIAKAQHDQASHYNARRMPAPPYKEGDRVVVNPHSLEWVESKGEGAKLGAKWIGPFEIQEVVNPKVFRLRMPDSYKGSPVINLWHLRMYIEPEPGERRTQLPVSECCAAESEEFEVESIVGHRRSKGRNKNLQFLVCWAGYSPLYDSWETALELKNAHEILAEYRKHHNI